MQVIGGTPRCLSAEGFLHVNAPWGTLRFTDPKEAT